MAVAATGAIAATPAVVGASAPSTINPNIIWATPAPITYPTPLGAKQLDATSPVSGTFSYSPAAGTVLSAGSHVLNVTFTPTNTAVYNTVTAHTTLLVNRAASRLTPALVNLANTTTFAALLTAQATGRALAGQPIVFTWGSQSCTATTGPKGVAKCSITLSVEAMRYTESFAGSLNYAPKSLSLPVLPLYDRVAQSNLTNELTSSKAAFTNDQGYDTSTNLVNTLNQDDPTISATTGDSTWWNVASVATFQSDGSTPATGVSDGVIVVLAVYQPKTETCWFAEDSEQTPQQASNAGSPFPAGTEFGKLFLGGTIPDCGIDQVSNVNDWQANGYPT